MLLTLTNLELRLFWYHTFLFSVRHIGCIDPHYWRSKWCTCVNILKQLHKSTCTTRSPKELTTFFLIAKVVHELFLATLLRIPHGLILISAAWSNCYWCYTFPRPSWYSRDSCVNRSLQNGQHLPISKSTPAFCTLHLISTHKCLISF